MYYRNDSSMLIFIRSLKCVVLRLHSKSFQDVPIIVIALYMSLYTTRSNLTVNVDEVQYNVRPVALRRSQRVYS